jgi:hypothetical protein
VPRKSSISSCDIHDKGQEAFHSTFSAIGAPGLSNSSGDKSGSTFLML